ncbi:hypothetical protein [Mycobacterium haemophilum]|nr:hypothetical protein [Mycobacterium haemophilum]MCV7340594.1 hypothetical protein [Mycobacterium haemophilum DSM 44634]
MPNPEDLEARIAAMEASLADALGVIKTVGATQSVLGDALREFITRLGSAESIAQNTNQRISALEKSAAEIKALLLKSLDG